MNPKINGAAIRRLRKEKHLTQEALAGRLHISSKAVSKWETGQGFPDISLLEPLARALDISVIELLSGDDVRNQNRAFNVSKTLFYVCPVCGNVILAAGEAVVSCCGMILLPVMAGVADELHAISVERSEDEYYVRLEHEMTKEHFISFLAAVSDQGIQFVKLYPEGGSEARFKINGVRKLYAFCSRHGLFEFTVSRDKAQIFL